MSSTGKTKEKLDRKLYDAVKKNKIQLVHQYLRQGADPDAKVGKNGTSAMTRAAKLKDRQVEIALLNSGGTLDTSSTLMSRKSIARNRKNRNSTSDGEGDDDGHWIANSHEAGPVKSTSPSDIDRVSHGVVKNSVSDVNGGAGEAITVSVTEPHSRGSLGAISTSATMRAIGDSKQFEGRWLYSKKVLERVSSVSVTSISLHVAPFPFNSWKLDILGETGSLLGSRMITIEADLLAADAKSLIIGPATLNVDALTWLLEKECRQLESDIRKSKLDFTSSPLV